VRKNLKEIADQPLNKALGAIIKRFNVLPTDDKFKDLTEEQVALIMQFFVQEKDNSVKYEDEEFEDWEEEASKDHGWAVSNDEWVEVPFEDEIDKKVDLPKDAFERAARNVIETLKRREDDA
jgi:hypothetical protein